MEKILLEHDPKAENILSALKRISAAFGYVSQKDAQKAAKYFNLPLSRVYETVSFYDLINIRKQPELAVKVCSGTNCAVNSSFEIISEIENLFHIKAGDENNPRIKLEIISCLGQCGEGPVVVVNDKIYTRVTASGVHEILEEWL